MLTCIYSRDHSRFAFVSALSTVTVGTATSVSQVQIKRFSQQENSTEVITVPVIGNNGSV